MRATPVSMATSFRARDTAELDEIYQLLDRLDEKGIADAKYNIAGALYKTDNPNLGLVHLLECKKMIQEVSNKVYKMKRSKKIKIPPKIQVGDLNIQRDDIILSRIAMYNSYINKFPSTILQTHRPIMRRMVCGATG